MFTFRKNTFFACKLNIYDTSSVTNPKQKKRKAKATTVKTDYLSPRIVFAVIKQIIWKNYIRLTT